MTTENAKMLDELAASLKKIGAKIDAVKATQRLADMERGTTRQTAASTAERQASFAARKRAAGFKQHHFFLTDIEYHAVKEFLKDLRGY